MLVRECAGGIVFYQDRVLLLKNEKGEWVLPKGKIRNNMLSADVAKERVLVEAGVEASIVVPAGESSYEFYSITRKSPVFNKVTWYIMEAKSDAFRINEELQYTDGGFFTIDDAMERITYSQDKGLVSYAHRKYLELNER